MSVKLWVFPTLLPLPFPLLLSPSFLLSVGLSCFLCVSLCLCVAPSVAFCHSLLTELVRKRDVLGDVGVPAPVGRPKPRFFSANWQCRYSAISEVQHLFDQLACAGFRSPCTSVVGGGAVYFITLNSLESSFPGWSCRHGVPFIFPEAVGSMVSYSAESKAWAPFL